MASIVLVAAIAGPLVRFTSIQTPAPTIHYAPVAQPANSISRFCRYETNVRPFLKPGILAEPIERLK